MPFEAPKVHFGALFFLTETEIYFKLGKHNHRKC